MQYKSVECDSCGHRFEIGSHIRTYTCNECGHIHQSGEESAAALMADREAPADGLSDQAPTAPSLTPDRLGEAERYCLQAEFILHKLQANVSVYGTNSGWTCPDPADVELALKYIDRSLEIWPDNPKYLNLKALFLMEGKGDREGGIALMERAAKIAPDDITIQDNLEKTKAQQQQCFIATAAFSADAWETAELRIWRDQDLLPNRTGKLFVRWYYAVSPSIADCISNRTPLRRAARLLLRPFARYLRWRRNQLVS